MCVLRIISDPSLCCVLTEHEGLWPEVLEVSGNVSSGDNTKKLDSGPQESWPKHTVFLHILFPSLGFSSATLQHPLSPPK